MQGNTVTDDAPRAAQGELSPRWASGPQPALRLVPLSPASQAQGQTQTHSASRILQPIGAALRPMAGATMLGAQGLAAWAAMILAIQAQGWMEHGSWQPVPVHAVFLAEPARKSLVRFSGMLNALDAAPSLGSHPSVQRVRASVSTMPAWARGAALHSLDAPLSVALLSLGLGLGTVAGVTQHLAPRPQDDD